MGGLAVELHACVEDDLAQSLAQLRATRLANHERLPGRELLAEQLDLRRLARALGALEGDEQAARHLAGHL